MTKVAREHAEHMPVARGRDWRKAMSDNVAYALLVYTGLTIFVTVTAMKTEGMSILPYLALVVLVGGIIPACRSFEKRWRDLPDAAAADEALAPAYRRDQLLLWLLAIGLPLLLTGLLKLIFAAAA
jgi:hypothetical protein